MINDSFYKFQNNLTRKSEKKRKKVGKASKLGIINLHTIVGRNIL